eukprot:5360211-Prymnesium_polylepis.1
MQRQRRRRSRLRQPIIHLAAIASPSRHRSRRVPSSDIASHHEAARRTGLACAACRETVLVWHVLCIDR